MPNFSVFDLKFSIFQLIRNEKSAVKTHWNQNLDELLVLISGTLYPQTLKPIAEKVKWIVVSREFCRRIGDIRFFMTDKQCKERWLNHLNPYLKRFFIRNLYFINFVYRNSWTKAEDLQLIHESIKFKTKWSKIARSVVGRTQHAVKNRFINLIAKALQIDKKDVRKSIKEKEAWKLAVKTLEFVGK